LKVANRVRNEEGNRWDDEWNDQKQASKPTAQKAPPPEQKPGADEPYRHKDSHVVDVWLKKSLCDAS